MLSVVGRQLLQLGDQAIDCLLLDHAAAPVMRSMVCE
jgi:hypothetical protein